MFGQLGKRQPLTRGRAAFTAILMLILTPVMFWGGFRFQSVENALKAHGKTVVGEITNKRESYGSKSTTYYVNYKFAASGTTNSGEDTVTEATFQSVNPGDKINVIYDSTNPEVNRTELTTKKNTAMFLFGIGAFLTLVCLFFGYKAITGRV